MSDKMPTPQGVVRSITELGAPLMGRRQSTQELKRQAEKARTQRDWALDLAYRRQISGMEPTKPGAWIQKGHALKEAGFHSRAAEAYLKARELGGDEGEAALQLGHLAKIRGDFGTAAREFETAVALGHPAADQIALELKLLRRIDNTLVFRGVNPKAPKAPLRVFLSVPGGQVQEGDKEAAAAGLGAADYSYSFAMRGFIQAFEEMEVDYTVIDKPEYISDIRERSGAEINIHLGFYPPERMRVLKGAYNINCFAWEFDRLRLPTEAFSHHAFADQAQMLDVADELWVTSQHATDAVAAQITKPATRVPSPVLSNLSRRPRSQRPDLRELERIGRDLAGVNWEPLSILPRLQPMLDNAARAKAASLPAILSSLDGEERPEIFLSVFNVHDYRKQIEPMLTGFMRFLEHRPNALLLLKMTTPHRAKRLANRILMEEQISDAGRLIPPMVSDRIWLTDSVLTRNELNRLYDAATYYVCTSYAEGQNLPLIEAMGRGVVPVTVNHTAMSDYISENDAVVIPSEPRPLDIRLTARYRMFGTDTNYVSAEDVRASLERAVTLEEADYAHRSSAAFEEVRSQFGLAPFAERFWNTVEQLKAGESQHDA